MTEQEFDDLFSVDTQKGPARGEIVFLVKNKNTGKVLYTAYYSFSEKELLPTLGLSHIKAFERINIIARSQIREFFGVEEKKGFFTGTVKMNNN